MYPETDLRTAVITKEILASIKIPETWEEKSKRLAKILPKDMIDQIIKSEYLEIFEKFMSIADPTVVANTFTSVIKDLRRKGVDTAFLTEENFADLFGLMSSKKISKEAIPGVLETVCKEKISVKEAVERGGLKAMDESQLRKIVKSIIAKYPDLAKEKKFSPLMGEVMKEVRGKIGGDLVSKVLKEELQ
jgi:Glu-tRNA(Gln) amidotransferase subunit E-like FAD-binding protein